MIAYAEGSLNGRAGSPAARRLRLLGRAVLGVVAVVASGCASLATGTAHEPAPPDPALAVRVWISTADRQQRLARQPDAQLHDAETATIEVDPGRRYQSMVGFGAAMTDASAWLIETRLNSTQRAALLTDLFGPEPGIRLGLVRLPIGASDFSQTHYSFDDLPAGETDPALAHFSIAPIERDVLPVMREALRLNPTLRVIASPWSAPAWMKTTHSLIRGTLLPEYYQAFSDYLIKYVDEMASRGIPIFALTLQNEPHFEPANYPGMQLTATARAQLIGRYLGPALARRASAPLILDWDHNWERPQEPLQVLDDPVAAPYVAGIAWHCYGGSIAAQEQVHVAHPDKDTYLTECSSGSWGPTPDASLLSMARQQIVAATRGWARGVLLWNIALDEAGGPHLGGCRTCRGLVTIDSHTGEVTRNDDYYALAHVSRFVQPGAERIESTATDAGLVNVAFRNPGGASLVLVAVNSASDPREISVACVGRAFDYVLPPQSVATFVWSDRQANR